MSEKLLTEIEQRLKAKNIYDLRQIGRVVGVSRPADGKKERVLSCILEIASGKSDPSAPAIKGARPKSNDYDRQLVADILRCREIFLAAQEKTQNQPMQFVVGSGVEYDPLEFTGEGILERTPSRWVLRLNDARDGVFSDVFVHERYVKIFSLREGDLVKGVCRRNSVDEFAGLTSVLSVNGLNPAALKGRADFNLFVPVYSDRRFTLSRGREDVLNRMIDLFSPLGVGQRAFVVAPHGSGNTEVLKQIALGLKSNNNVKLIIALIDSSPEEAVDFKRTFADSDVFASAFGTGANGNVRTAYLALEYAKRQAELGGDVVLVLDNLNRLVNAYNSVDRQVSHVLDAEALDNVKRYLSSAKNTENGASLTIVSALSADGSPLDEAAYYGLADICNMRVTLSRRYVSTRIFPYVDIAETYASGESRLLDKNELSAAHKLREQDYDEIKRLILDTTNNAELCKNILKNN